MNDTVVPKRKKLQRVAADDFSFCEEALKTAELLIVPDDQTQRAAFEKLMPHLYVLRNKGCSWPQLTALLNKSGFKLQPSTVRSYYSEMLLKSMNLCQARMNVQIDLMRKLREENARHAGGDSQLAAMAQRVNSQMNKLLQTNSARVNEMFELDPLQQNQPALSSPAVAVQPTAAAASAALAHTPPSQAAQPPRPAPSRPAPPPAPQVAPDTEETNQFGLLGLGPAQRSADRPAGFFSLDTEPGTGSSPPVAAQRTTPTPRPAPAAAPATSQPPAPNTAPQLPIAHAQVTANSAPDTHNPGAATIIRKRCSPLTAGIAPLKKRDKVPPEVYEPGDMEHPAIPGLILSMEERMYGAGLEYCDETGDEAGVYRTETADEKRFRVTWRKVVPMTPTRTADSFMPMDTSLFKGRS